MELDGLFAEVRAVLQQAPSVVTFDALTVVLGDGDAPADVIAYADGHLAHWPPDIRREAPVAWTDAMMRGAAVPAHRLSNAIRIASDPTLDDVVRLLGAWEGRRLRRLALGEDVGILAHAENLSNLEVLRTTLRWDDPVSDVLSASPVFGERARIELRGM